MLRVSQINELVCINSLMVNILHYDTSAADMYNTALYREIYLSEWTVDRNRQVNQFHRFKRGVGSERSFEPLIV